MERWTWYDPNDSRGVLELNAADPALELELMLYFSPHENLPPQVVWIHSQTGWPVWYPVVGVVQ